MADLTIDDLLKRINQDPALQAVFSGSKQIETVGNRHHIVPSELYAVTYDSGDLPVGTVTNIQTFRDGNVYKLPEKTTDGFELLVYFDNVTSFQEVFFSVHYYGSTSHWVTVGLLEYPEATTYRTIRVLQHMANVADSGTDMDTFTIKIPKSSQFISASRRTTLQFKHGTGGTNTHNLYLDYAALVV